MSEIYIINKFRDDAVLITSQNSSGFMDAHCVDFPKIKDRKKQLLIALAGELGLVDDDWCKELYDMVEQNNKDIDEELTTLFSELKGATIIDEDDYSNPEEVLIEIPDEAEEH